MEAPASRHHFGPFSFLIGFGVGAFVGVALALVAIALAQGTSSSDDPKTALLPTETPLPIRAGVTPTPDTRPRTKAQLEVRLGPGAAFAVIGTMQRGEAVDVVGRDNDANWLAIRFPPGSAGRGWLPVSDLEGVSGLERVSVALPTPLPRSVTVPQSSFPPGGGVGSFEIGSTPTSTLGPLSPLNGLVTPTPMRGAPIDLVVSRISLLADGHVSVLVGNRGPGEINGQTIFVTLRDAALHTEQLSLDGARIPSGGTIALVSRSFVVSRQIDVTAVVDPFATVNDLERSNNSLTLTLTPAPTPTPFVSGQ